jgi:hypothetical protein
MQHRPQSLEEISVETANLAEFGLHVRDFLREWNLAGQARRDLGRLIEAEPVFLAGAVEQGEVCDAFLAALADHLAQQAGLAAPEWIDSPRRRLSQPWFALESETARNWLRREALPVFSERNLFIDSSALARL